MKKFDYGTILVSFFSETVPHLRPQVAFTELRERDPRMIGWVEIMVLHGGGGSKMKYMTEFFLWLDY